jgi:hypothetical protein
MSPTGWAPTIAAVLSDGGFPSDQPQCVREPTAPLSPVGADPVGDAVRGTFRVLRRLALDRSCRTRGPERLGERCRPQGGLLRPGVSVVCQVWDAAGSVVLPWVAFPSIRLSVSERPWCPPSRRVVGDEVGGREQPPKAGPAMDGRSFETEPGKASFKPPSARRFAAVGQISTHAAERHSLSNVGDLSEQRGWAPRALSGDVRALTRWRKPSHPERSRRRALSP